MIKMIWQEPASGNRQRRAAGKGKGKEKGERAEKKAEKQAKKQAKKEAKKEAKRADKKAKKEANKESLNAEKDGRKKALSKLGLKKMPSKSTLEKLTCVHDKITELLIRCAKNILSQTNQMCKEKIEKKEITLNTKSY